MRGLMPSDTGPVGVYHERPSVPVSEGSGLNLPPEFWETRPLFAHVLQAADSRLVSPDALLVGVLTRFAALIPASVQIPAVVGSNATFDFIGCVVASSSGGKTISNNVAADLVPGMRKDVLFDAPVGSGEGLISAFMGWEKDEAGKRVGDPSYKFGEYKAIHFNIDEGTGLMEQQARKGTTIVQTMCSAWSGAAMGQLNASMETKRLIPKRARRVAAMVNIQTGFGHQLLSDNMKNVGLPQRMVFSWAHSTPPDEQPVWPGPIDTPRLPSHGQTFTVELAPEISQELIQIRMDVMAGRLILGELDGHTNLVRLKIACMFGLLDGRMDCTIEDWKLAGMVTDVSTAVRSRLIHVKRDADAKAIEATGISQGERSAVAETAKERRLVAQMAESIRNAVADEPRSWAKLRKNRGSKEAKQRFPAAVQLAVDNGWVVVEEVTHRGQTGKQIRKAK